MGANGTRLRDPSKSKSLSKSDLECYKILLGRYIRIIDFDPDWLMSPPARYDFDPDYWLIRVPLWCGGGGSTPLATRLGLHGPWFFGKPNGLGAVVFHE